MITIFIQLFLYASWSAHIEPQLSIDAAASLLSLVVLASLSALFARLSLVSSPTD
jgi:hypothetical protein